MWGEDIPLWAYLAFSASCGALVWWLGRKPDPDRGKTYWEKRAPELEEVAAHLRVARQSG